MTAEVAILNRSAVALAADSAVTISNRASSKIYNTVNKLFSLSKFEPMGLMIFGNADYMSVPWETIVKLYREKLGTNSFDTVDGYATDFISFVKTDIHVSEQAQKKRVREFWGAYFEALSNRLRQRLLDAAQRKTLVNSDVVAIFLSVLTVEIERLKKRPSLVEFKKIDPITLVQKYNDEFSEAKDVNFRGKKFTPEIMRLLKQYAGLLVVKEEFSHSISGVVIAGFGKKQIYPSLRTTVWTGIIFNKPRLLSGGGYTVDPDQNSLASISAFAQKEMVVRYMEGVDELYSHYMEKGITRLMTRVSDGLILKYGRGTIPSRKKLAIKVRQVTIKMVNQFLKEAEGLRKGYFAQQVIQTVAILPKEEIAELAGALVNLTSLKRKISMDADTVGGPIDVAVISKGDGFIWIKRKHYFTQDLNPLFVQKYLMNQSAGGAP